MTDYRYLGEPGALSRYDESTRQMWWDAWDREWVDAVRSFRQPPPPPPFPRVKCVDCGKHLEGKEVGYKTCAPCDRDAMEAELRGDRERDERAWA